MKIAVEGSQVKLIPETDHERDNLDVLWKLLIRCDKDSKVLCPVGQYLPQQDEAASFIIQDQ